MLVSVNKPLLQKAAAPLAYQLQCGTDGGFFAGRSRYRPFLCTVFYQEINGVQYELKNEEINAMGIFDVFKTRYSTLLKTIIFYLYYDD